MALIHCPECRTEMSDRAAACPKCGHPIGSASLPPEEKKRDIEGSWCPQCGNRLSHKQTKAGCFYWIMVALFIFLPLILYPFLPRVWRCEVCKNEWPA